MDFDAHFQGFLISTVNLKPWKLDLLDARVAAITRAFQLDEVMGGLYKEHIPQGSWAQQTIINPVGKLDQFDADILLHLEQVPGWSEDPKIYLQQVRAAFKRSNTYKDMLTRKNRCVRIEYAGDCHVDVVPAVTLDDGRQMIMTYKENEFEETNPAGFADWMRERDGLTDGNLRRVIRLMKWLRDYKNTFSCPSVILTVLLGGRVHHAGSDRYRDIPTALLNLLEDLDAWLEGRELMPLLDDPSCPGTSFNHRWDEDEYRTFKTKAQHYAVWAREAYDLQGIDDYAAIKAWQKLFGPEFAAHEVKEAAAEFTSRRALTATSSTKALGLAAPGEEFIHDKASRVERRYDATIEAVVMGTFPRPLRKQRVVGTGKSLRFRLRTDAPEPYEVWWKVRNHGDAAEDADDLRGQIFRQGNDGRAQHRETTSYPGHHYIEAYVIRNGVVVASDHHAVTIVGRPG